MPATEAAVARTALGGKADRVVVRMGYPSVPEVLRAREGEPSLGERRNRISMVRPTLPAYRSARSRSPATGPKTPVSCSDGLPGAHRRRLPPARRMDPVRGGHLPGARGRPLGADRGQRDREDHLAAAD